ncbi:hypothetical protein [Streptomyces sp. NPDC047046]|uniref:hypothetical protein n=1 Tax=Streptomyces sp. NPDC047046 TaxID=3155378 RepID=UPI0033C0E80C
MTDGLLNALTLAASALLGSSNGPDFALAVRVGTAALITAAFTVFVADYADRRAQLVRAEKELNLLKSGHLATTRLGRRALTRSIASMGVACVSSFIGAALPLVAGVVLPGPSWLVPALAVGALAALGTALASVVNGRKGRWTLAMAIGGIAVTAMGVQLHIA